MIGEGSNMKLTTNVALSFLSEVKKRFQDQNENYNYFIELMKDFKSKRIDIDSLIARLTELFKGDREVIMGFNAFLPKEYLITLPNEDELTSTKKPAEFGVAFNFLNKIKTRFQGNEHVYKSFIDILDMYMKKTKTIRDVNQEVINLFRDHIDLIEEFGHFLPRLSGQMSNSSPQPKRNNIVHSNYRSSSVSTMRTGRVAKAAASHDGWYFNVDEPDRDHDKVVMGIHGEIGRNCNREMERRDGTKWRKRELDDRDYAYVGAQHISPNGKTAPKIEEPITDQFHQGAFWSNEHTPISVEVYDSDRDQDSEKNYKDRDPESRERKRLDRVASGDKDESGSKMSLYSTKDDYFVKPILSNCERCTPSYRILPKNYPMPSVSGRSDIDDKVLNDCWVSFTSGSEDYSFKHMRKNQFEESLFRCEDDRYELDMLLESVKATIRSAEGLVDKINDNTIKTGSIQIEDHFTALNLRCIERVYGDHGLDVMELLRKNPQLPLEVILNRLKQKLEEWTRCRSDFSKVWAEIFAKNYHRSLDRRSFYFKQQDSKSLSAKALLAEIEEISKKQQGGDDVLLSITTGTRLPIIPNLEFKLPDFDIHVYVYQLIKNSCQYMCKAERFDRVMKVYTTLLKPMLGISSHLQHVEDVEGEFLKAVVVANSGAPCIGETDGSPVGVAVTNNIRQSIVVNALREHSSSSTWLVSNDDGVNKDNFHDPDHISLNSDTIYENPHLEKVHISVTPIDEISRIREIELLEYSTISAAEVDSYGRAHEENTPGLFATLNTGNAAANGRLYKNLPTSEEGGDWSKPVSDSIGSMTERINGQTCTKESRPQFTNEREEGELSPCGDYEGHNLQAHGEAKLKPEDSATNMQYQTTHNEDVCEEDEVDNDVDDDEKGDVHLKSAKPLLVHVPLLLHDKEKSSQIFYGNDSFYVLFRLYQTLYDRIKFVKSSTERKCSNDTTPSDLCTSFMNAFYKLLDGSSDYTEFENHCRALMGADSHVLFTLDKLVKRLVNQLETVATNDLDNKLLELYAYEKSRGGSVVDIVYHNNARALLHNEYIYRIECSSEPLNLSMQLMDYGYDKTELDVVCVNPNVASYMGKKLLLPEEKQNSGIVLKRNKRKFACGDELFDSNQAMEGLQIYNGLQCRIVTSSGKVDYILGTEDFLCRKKKKTLHIAVAQAMTRQII